MSARAVIGATSLAMVLIAAGSAFAADVTAEVRTWAGLSWRLSEPSLVTFYTVMTRPPQRAGLVPPPPAAGAGPASADSGNPLMALFGGAGAPAPNNEPEPRQARGERAVVTLWRAGVQIQVAVSDIASLEFARTAVASTLPPYVGATHFRYAATAVLTDGSRIEADDVNLGTTVLQGTSGHARIEIPWEEIAAVRFERGSKEGGT